MSKYARKLVSKQITDCLIFQEQTIEQLMNKLSTKCANSDHDTSLQNSVSIRDTSFAGSELNERLLILEREVEVLKQENHILHDRNDNEVRKREGTHAELEILTSQLAQEKQVFENAFGLMKSRALEENSKNEDLSMKCSALEAMILKKDQEIENQDGQIQDLRTQLKKHKEANKHLLSDMSLKMQQELYLDKVIGNGTQENGNEIKSSKKIRKEKNTKKFTKDGQFFWQ